MTMVDITLATWTPLDRWPKLKRDWKGLVVRSRRPIHNGWVEIKRGSILTVTYARGWMSLTTEPCPACGVKVFISRVSVADVELLGRKSGDRDNHG